MGADDPVATVASVADFYVQAGFANIPGVDDQPDHIGAELRFLSLLCTAEAEALAQQEIAQSNEYRASRLRFLSGHVNRWIPQCCQRIREATQQPFYEGLTDAIESMISDDHASLIGDNSISSEGYLRSAPAGTGR